jgi:hypothetical protein
MRKKGEEKIHWVVNQTSAGKRQVYILANGQQAFSTSKQWETVEPTEEEIAHFQEREAQEEQKRKDEENAFDEWLLQCGGGEESEAVEATELAAQKLAAQKRREEREERLLTKAAVARIAERGAIQLEWFESESSSSSEEEEDEEENED